MIKKDARDVAVSAITAFRKRSAWTDGFLRNEIRSCNLSPQDAALATEIVNGVLQNMLLINHYIKSFSSLRLNKISPGILDILQMAVYQTIFLDRVPNSAAINDAVKRAKKNNPRAAGFVNAVARKISSQKNNLPEIKGNPAEILSVKYSHPLWLVEKFISVYGAETAEKILSANNEKTAISVRVNTLKISSNEFLQREADFVAGIIPDSAYITNSRGIEKRDSFKNGEFQVQDISSQLAALTLAPKENSKVLDSCAAPGGKSFLMAQLMKNTGDIISCDIYPHKLELIKNRAETLGIKNITVRLQNAAEFNAQFENAFDYVLTDVPCSGIGIIRKKPDIRYKDEEEIKMLPELQLSILKNSARYVKQGGCLLYSTCTILPEENCEVVRKFLEENNSFVEEKEYFDIPCEENLYGITLLPHLGRTDGFYMCKLRRIK